MDTALLAALCGFVGLFIGSFLNVVIYRVPAGLSVVSPRSRFTHAASNCASGSESAPSGHEKVARPPSSSVIHSASMSASSQEAKYPMVRSLSSNISGMSMTCPPILVPVPELVEI